MLEWNIEGIAEGVVDEIFEDYTKEEIESGEVAIEDYIEDVSWSIYSREPSSKIIEKTLLKIEEQIDWTISERLSAMEM
jgi:hypothetical protein